MEVRAVAKFVKVKPLMVRQVAREIRGKMAIAMVNELRFKAGQGAFVLHKVLVSAISNAEANHQLDAETLRISQVKVDEGPRMKRMRARAMGRGNRILKRTAHITIVVAEGEPDPAKPTRGKNIKPRPTLKKVVGKRKAAAPKAAPVAPVEDTQIEETKVEEAPVMTEVTPEVEEAPIATKPVVKAEKAAETKTEEPS